MSAFQTASEFFDPNEPDGDQEAADGGVPFAKSIVWYDPTAPIFVCADHARILQPLRFAGSERVDPTTANAIREQAYRWLFEADPRCDACEGRLREVVAGAE